MKKLFVYVISLGLFFSACTIIDEETLVTNNITEGITVSTTWTADNVWIIDGGISITADLVIEPGTIVKFNEGAYLYVGYGTYGSLKANGTIEKPILFTSNASSPSAGDWKGIQFYQYAGNKSTLDHCKIEYAGNSDSYDGALYIEYASISLQNTTISNSATNGVYNYEGGFVSFTGNIITNCQGYPLVLPAETVHIVTFDNVFDPKGVLVNHNDIKNQIVSWNALAVPYILNGLNINDDGELTIEEGATLLFNAGASVYIGYGSYGKLVANGTIEKPIVFSSNASSPSAGDWKGIQFFQHAGNKSTLDHCIIEYAGNSDSYDGALYIEYGSISLQNTTISNSATNGVYNYNGGFVSFTGNSITNCQGYPMVLPAKTVHIVTSDNVFDPKGILVNNDDIKNQVVSWNALTVPYILDGLNINDNGELTIEAGTTLLFKAGASVYIGYGSYGKLVANGTTELPVIFSSSASSPSPGDWQGINFYQYTANGSLINNCIVSYGGATDGNDANIYSEYNGSKLTITNSEISYSQNCGISTYSSTPLISGITYIGNGSNECGDLVP